MERILNLVFTAENVRMLVLLVFGFCGYVLLSQKIGNVEVSLNKRIDGVEASLSQQIYDLKHNDIAHLNNAIEALTFTLEKNGSINLCRPVKES